MREQSKWRPEHTELFRVRVLFYSYSSISVKHVFLLGRRDCLRSEQGGEEEPSSAYFLVFIKLRLSTHLYTASISSLLHMLTLLQNMQGYWKLLSISKKLKSVPGSCSVGFLPLRKSLAPVTPCKVALSPSTSSIAPSRKPSTGGVFGSS